MKILAVLAHPNPKSFTRALMDEFVASAESAGHAITIADLNAEEFDPRFNLDDVAVYNGLAEVTEGIAAEQKRVAEADAMVFFFPLWWWSMPSILKGWIDRVFNAGFAFNYIEGISSGLLAHKKVALFCPAATDVGQYRKYGYHGALQRLVDAGIFGYCGITDVQTHIFPEVEANEEARAKHLAFARAAAESFKDSSGLGDVAFS